MGESFQILRWRPRARMRVRIGWSWFCRAHPAGRLAAPSTSPRGGVLCPHFRTPITETAPALRLPLPEPAMQLDRLIATTAAQEYVPLYVPAQRGRRASHLWVVHDRDQYLDATSDVLAEPETGNIDDQDPAEQHVFPWTAPAPTSKGRKKPPNGTAPRGTPAPFCTPASRPGRTTPVLPSQRREPAAAPHRAPPAPRPAPQQQQERLTAATRLGCAAKHVGPCASCRELTHRYGVGGNPLCVACRERRRC